MKYIIYKEIIQNNRKNGSISKILKKILPEANPDFDDIYGNVTIWWLEINETNGSIEREIGINIDRKTIAIGPLGRNYGLWTDSLALIKDTNEYESITEIEFNNKWNQYIQNHSER